MLIDIIFHLVDQYFKDIKDRDLLNNDKIFEIKNYILDNLNSFMIYNINQNSLINALNDKLKHE